MVPRPNFHIFHSTETILCYVARNILLQHFIQQQNAKWNKGEIFLNSCSELKVFFLEKLFHSIVEVRNTMIMSFLIPFFIVEKLSKLEF